MYEKILVGIDGSDDAQRAAERAIDIARRDKSIVVIFHSVLHPFTGVSPNVAGIFSGSSSVYLTLHTILGNSLLVEDIHT